MLRDGRPHCSYNADRHERLTCSFDIFELVVAVCISLNKFVAIGRICSSLHIPIGFRDYRLQTNDRLIRRLDVFYPNQREATPQ